MEGYSTSTLGVTEPSAHLPFWHRAAAEGSCGRQYSPPQRAMNATVLPDIEDRSLLLEQVSAMVVHRYLVLSG